MPIPKRGIRPLFLSTEPRIMEFAKMSIKSRWMQRNPFRSSDSNAEKLRAQAQEFANVKRHASMQLAKIPASSKGMRVSKKGWKKWLAIGVGAGIIGAFALRPRLQR